MKICKISEIIKIVEKEEISKLLEGRTCWNCKNYPCPLIGLLWRFVSALGEEVSELHHCIEYFMLLKVFAHLCQDFEEVKD